MNEIIIALTQNESKAPGSKFQRFSVLVRTARYWRLLAVKPIELAVRKVHNQNIGNTHYIHKEKEMKNKYFNSVLMIVCALVLLLSACGSVPSAPTTTPTIAATNTPEPTATATQTSVPTKTPSPTITPDLAATKQYEDFFALVQKYHDAGQTSTTEGE